MALVTTDAQQKAMGKDWTVGLKQITNPTPMFLKTPMRILQFLSGLWVVIQPQLVDLPIELTDRINRYIILGNTVVFFAVKFFGWDYKQD